MTVRWEHLAGDRSRFAIRLRFLDDPDGAEESEAGLSASWGAFQIWVGGVNLCAHSVLSERVDQVHWHLLPMLEWFARNWNALLHKERLPCGSKEDTGWLALHASPQPTADGLEAEWQQWWSRHALCAAREGGVFPDVVLRALGDAVEVSWGPNPVAGAPPHLAFDAAQARSETLPRASVAEPLGEVLLAASEHLASVAPESDRVRRFSGAIREFL